MSTVSINTLNDLDVAVSDILEKLRLSNLDKAVVLALSGDLGAGKTTLVQTLFKKLGVTEVVTSPTFVVMKQYGTDDSDFKNLVHIDAYRIESKDEMRPLRFSDYLEQSNTLICIEWAEKITPLLPPNFIQITLSADRGDMRTLTINYGN